MWQEIVQALRHPHGEVPSRRWVARRSRVGAPSSSVRPPAWDRCSCGRSAPSGGARRHGHAASAWPSSPVTSRGPRAGCCARRGASTCSACGAPTPCAGASRCACAVAAGPGAPGWCSPSTATTRRTPAPASGRPIRCGPGAATSCSCAPRGRCAASCGCTSSPFPPPACRRPSRVRRPAPSSRPRPGPRRRSSPVPRGGPAPCRRARRPTTASCRWPSSITR